MKMIYHNGLFFAPAKIVSMELKFGRWHVVGDGGSFIIDLDPEADAETVETVIKCLSVVNKESVIKK